MSSSYGHGEGSSNGLGLLSFIEHLERTGKEPASKTYYYVLNAYARWLGKALDQLTPDDFSPAEVQTYMAQLEKPRTANTFLSACRSYAKYRWLNSKPDNIMDYLTEDRFYKGMYSIPYREIPELVRVKALDIDTLASLLSIIEEDVGGDSLLYAGVMVHFYLGARPVELACPYDFGAIDFRNPQLVYRVDMRKKVISIITAKARGTKQRVVPFPDSMDEYVRRWFKSKVGTYCRPREWMTKRLKKYSRRLGVDVTAKTARQTVETHFKRERLEQWVTNYWLGHTTTIPDIYSDFSLLIRDMREWMEQEEKHYMIRHGLV